LLGFKLLNLGDTKVITMGIAVRRRNRRVGRSSDFINIPKPLKAGLESTIAANRLVLADPRGEIPEEDLLRFYEKYVEPAFWRWWESRGRKR